ncbi:MAG: beta-galactosidase [Candidatus Paceibacterota bacterium]
MRLWKKILIGFGVLVFLFGVALFFLAQKERPEEVIYGMSFNTLYARELGLDWREVYDAIIDDLGVRHLRLAAHWPMVEETPGTYNFEELDYQLARAEEVGADVIFAVGRRLPRWPECHIPEWSMTLAWEDQKKEIREYINAVITRYKDHPSITHWQVENEPYLEVFAKEYCNELDEEFLIEEIELVRTLDGTRPILVTDSGNLGLWSGAYRHGDAFGTSVYVYFWNPDVGQFKTILPAWSYRVKENVMRLLYGDKQTFLIELAAEPWLVEPITDVDIETQYSRMDLTKFNEILTYARATHYEYQYLWGAEWWYWLKEKGHPEIWERGQELFPESR